MGILDDAIREHLELKRQHGAEDEDLERLEKEAFGAPARPGDPEFGEEPQTGAEPAVAEAPAAEGSSTGDWLAEEETTVVPQAPAAPEASEPAGSSTPAEQARVKHAHLDDTADHPAPEDEPSAEEPQPPARSEPEPPATSEPQPPAGPVAEAEAPAEPQPEEAPPATEPLPPSGESQAPESEVTEAPERAIFDAEEFDFEEVDLDLDEEDDGTVGPQSADQPAAPFVEDDTDNPPLPVDRPREEGQGEEATEGEDLLEETPDFLQDAPEGEDLWFEQGPPKDFDFDDD